MSRRVRVGVLVGFSLKAGQLVWKNWQMGGTEVKDRLRKNTNIDTNTVTNSTQIQIQIQIQLQIGGQSAGANGGTEVRDRLGNGSNTNGLLHSKQP